MGSKREGQSSFRNQIDPRRAEIDMLIKQKLDQKGSNSYRKKRHSTLDMIEYYDYDIEGREHDAPINEQEIQNEDNKLSFNAKIRKRGKNVSEIKFTLKVTESINL